MFWTLNDFLILPSNLLLTYILIFGSSTLFQSHLIVRGQQVKRENSRKMRILCCQLTTEQLFPHSSPEFSSPLALPRSQPLPWLLGRGTALYHREMAKTFLLCCLWHSSDNGELTLAEDNAHPWLIWPGYWAGMFKCLVPSETLRHPPRHPKWSQEIHPAVTVTSSPPMALQPRLSQGLAYLSENHCSYQQPKL